MALTQLEHRPRGTGRVTGFRRIYVRGTVAFMYIGLLLVWIPLAIILLFLQPDVFDAE